MPPPADAPGSPRPTDAERERAIEALRDAAGEGRLGLEELVDRIDAADKATSAEELEALTRDLFAAPSAGVQTDALARYTTVVGDLRRSGAWAVPARSRWQTVLGDIVLDLREARVGTPEVHIDFGIVIGDMELLVPQNVAVEMRARTVVGDVAQEAGTTGAPGAPRVVLTGRTVVGDVKVRSQRLRERVAARLGLRGG